ncbi:MAG: ferrous iron transport protein A, partial [Anaerolineae bacterium]|nr:ferrous iron transport protein A [Phycisphaerae bacterium]
NPSFLQFVDRRGLTPGTNLIVESRDPNAAAVVVKPVDANQATLGLDAAAKILVEAI